MKKDVRELQKLLEEYIDKNSYWHDDHLCIDSDTEVFAETFFKQVFCKHKNRLRASSCDYCVDCKKDFFID